MYINFTYKAHIKLLHKNFFFLTGKQVEASLEMLYSHPYFLNMSVYCPCRFLRLCKKCNLDKLIAYKCWRLWVCNSLLSCRDLNEKLRVSMRNCNVAMRPICTSVHQRFEPNMLRNNWALLNTTFHRNTKVWQCWLIKELVFKKFDETILSTFYLEVSGK